MDSSPDAPRSPPTLRTVGEILAWTQSRFQELDLPSARLDAELLLAHVLGSSRLDLYTGYHAPVEANERAAYRELVKRRARREPVAYLIGTKEFFSLELEVSPAVLIPRPETEHVVEAALAELPPDSGSETGDGPLVLDLGTGSGNIAIAVAHDRPDVRVAAVDSSREALEVARRNAARHGVDGRIRFLEGDLFEGLGPDDGPYRVIASNPPYVRGDEFDRLMPDVRDHEPRQALVDGKSRNGDGLGFYRDIARSAATRMAPGGALVLEVGDGQAAEVRSILEAAGLRPYRTVADLAGIDRVVVARSDGGSQGHSPERRDASHPSSLPRGST